MRQSSQLPWTMAVIACFCVSGPLAAHEFWIDTTPSRPAHDAFLSADLRVGQDLSGSALPYLDKTIKAMTHIAPAASRPLRARLGDSPAIKAVDLQEEGLHILSVETKPAYIVFDTMPEFEGYLAYEGLSGIAELHLKRNLPETGIAEEYIRNARALVQRGPVDAQDMDRPTGMPIEIIVKGTPFTTGLSTVVVRLEWQGAATPDAQIALFHLPNGGAAPRDTVRTVAQTDHNGEAEFPLMGAGQYLLNAVRTDPVKGPGSVVWQSHWASLSFVIEEAQ